MTQDPASEYTTRIGAVLSSGGGRGVFAHTGFMLALDRLNIQLGAAAGCSAGAVVGGVIASGTSIKDWAAAALRASVSQYWTPLSSWQLLYDLSFKKGRGLSGLSDTAAAVNFLSRQLVSDTFEDSRYPFVAAAVNLGNGKKVLFNKGLLAPRIMASAAMPGFYEPVEIDGEYFTDGAIIDLTPTDAICCQHQLDVLLVHHVANRNFSTQELKSAFDKPWTIVNVLHRLIYRRRPWYETGQPLAIHPCPCGCKAVMVIIEPELPEVTWPDRSKAETIVSLAQTHTLSQLQPILQSLGADPRSLLG